MATVAGVAFIKIGGQSFESDGEFSIKIKRVSREWVPNASGAALFSETPIMDTISGSLITLGGFDKLEIAQASDVTVQVQLKDGSVAVLRNAVFTGDASIETKSGKFNVEFTGIGEWVS